MNEPFVEVNNLTKQIRGKTIVHHISFHLNRGEVFGLLGPNGAGKTTTIRMMVGLIAMSDGDVRIGGSSIRSQFKEAIRHVGAIVENPELYKHLTGMQNLKQYARMGDGITQSRIEEVISLVGLASRIHDRVKTYSLGMRQRLGIAQALLHKPAVLILDEPTNGLDPAGIREMRGLVRKLAHEEGIAVMVSSHLLAEMEQLCDRFGVMMDGRLRTTFALADLSGTAAGDSATKRPQTLEEKYMQLTEGDNHAASNTQTAR
ncbi:ABC transporter ATP-binding protein [Paenibacillus sp. BC26]|uniref:ABC transporter ATP-binding protein n=1 Tax=Paenibacillus sp. BC26 TaxID=1881032 RepID=UPI0008EF800D|nr:ATP-binding cassette domain-containing protein [Paenibacillus sp. BC26]SFS71310.1 ABC-2 type transport system ATP-binding protein [Paenibacillus sp. BC26]